ncbi:MAG: nuclear transport factor 2 family protein [Acidimicrobiia bacterium]|nr:nuclear transport factor 2 family protein [Acidimicrobiia bacterium]
MSQTDTTARDEGAIRRLLAEYCHAYDDGRADDFAALFTQDAQFTVMGVTHSGREAIRENIGGWKSGTPPGQHITYNTVLDITGDSATGATDFSYLQTSDEGPRVIQAGRYTDEFVHEPDGWRFRSRTIRFLGDDA